jgi:hypothetical protein
MRWRDVKHDVAAVEEREIAKNTEEAGNASTPKALADILNRCRARQIRELAKEVVWQLSPWPQPMRSGRHRTELHVSRGRSVSNAGEVGFEAFKVQFFVF